MKGVKGPTRLFYSLVEEHVLHDKTSTLIKIIRSQWHENYQTPVDVTSNNHVLSLTIAQSLHLY